MPPDSQIHLHFISSELAVRQSLTRLMTQLRKTRLCEDDLGRVELMLAEVLNNVVEHAYGAGAYGPVDLTCDLFEDVLKLVVVDQGRDLPSDMFQPREFADPTQMSDDLPEGGWGWTLIQSLAKTISYTRQEDVNVLTLTLDVDTPQAAIG
ncbi:MAG: ATP-binding protein [Thalassovita sp.]